MKGRALFLLLLASCSVDEDFAQPLTPLQVRSRIVGHSMRATDSSGASYGIYFRRTDFAEIYDDTVEYVRWYTDDAHGLCLQLRDEPERCAPLYQLNVAHFRWGDTVLSVLDIRIPEPGFPRH